jgi:HTH-type transcriptional repressor of NAD biosynthesis genes
MKRGLIIGKFMPIHAGHVGLIRFARQHCDELIVSMSYTPLDPINEQLRFNWIKEIFKDDPKITIEISLDNFDNERLPMTERIKIWGNFLRKRFPPVDVIFSSELYGELLAFELGANHRPFDLGRTQFPVSASQIRTSPFTYWQFIPQEVKPYYVKKVCFYGAESTGKSTMAKRMAEIYQTEFVPEVAREIISSNDFAMDDIIRIGNAQTQRVKDKLKIANKILFCDTDVITTQIYSRQYLHQVPEVLIKLEKEISYDLYFLFYPDVPWVADGLRDLGSQREEMAKIFEEELSTRRIQPIPVKGTWTEREIIVRKVIDILLQRG